MSRGKAETKERRSSYRWEASHFFQPGKEYKRRYFDVIDRKTAESIGHLVDMSIDGIRISTPVEIAKGRPYSLTIELPDEVQDCKTIQLAARSMWCTPDQENGGFCAGFEILSIAPPYGEIVGALVQI